MVSLRGTTVTKQSPSIILRRIAYGDFDLVVTFFSRDGGRMSGMAKSARRSVKRFGGALEPATLVELTYAERRGSHMVRIEEAMVLRPAIGAVKSIERVNAMARAIDLALAFLQEHERSPAKFDLLEERIAAICQGQTSVSSAIAFELEWLKLCGFGPNLGSCPVCGDVDVAVCGDVQDGSSPGRAFDFDHGGIMCMPCGKTKRASKGSLVSPGAAKGLAMMREGAPPDDEASLEISVLLRDYIDHVVGRRLKPRIF